MEKLKNTAPVEGAEVTPVATPAKAPKKVAPKKAEKMVPASEVETMRGLMLQTFKDEIANLKREMMHKSNAPIYVEKESDLPPEYDAEDYLERPAVFFTHCIGRTYISDRRGGKEFFNPLGKTKKVYFEHFATKRTGEGRDIRMVHIARAMTHSKKEAEWLRHHTCYGIEFYELLPDMDKIDMNKEDLRLEAGDRLKKMNDDTILHMTKEYQKKKYPGIQVLENFQLMRQALIPIMLKQVEKEHAARLAVVKLEKDGTQVLQQAGDFVVTN